MFDVLPPSENGNMLYAQNATKNMYRSMYDDVGIAFASMIYVSIEFHLTGIDFICIRHQTKQQRYKSMVSYLDEKWLIKKGNRENFTGQTHVTFKCWKIHHVNTHLSFFLLPFCFFGHFSNQFQIMNMNLFFEPRSQLNWVHLRNNRRIMNETT